MRCPPVGAITQVQLALWRAHPPDALIARSARALLVCYSNLICARAGTSGGYAPRACHGQRVAIIMRNPASGDDDDDDGFLGLVFACICTVAKESSPHVRS